MRHVAQLLLVGMLVSGASEFTNSQSATVFRGVPVVKVSEGGYDRLVENLQRSQAINLACVISQINDKYYWASRENKELVRREAGAFITYTTLDGSGYIRIIAPGSKENASLLSDAEAKYDYVEHLLIGLRSVTYYGRSD